MGNLFCKGGWYNLRHYLTGMGVSASAQILLLQSPVGFAAESFLEDDKPVLPGVFVDHHPQPRGKLPPKPRFSPGLGYKARPSHPHMSGIGVVGQPDFSSEGFNSFYDPVDGAPERSGSSLWYKESHHKSGNEYDSPRSSHSPYDPRHLNAHDRTNLAAAQTRLLIHPRIDFDKAVKAFLGGGDLKRLALYGHHWNIGQAQISVLGHRVIMNGIVEHTSHSGFNHPVFFEAVFIQGRPHVSIQTGENINYTAFILKPMSYMLKLLALVHYKGGYKELEFQKESHILNRDYRKERARLSTHGTGGAEGTGVAEGTGNSKAELQQLDLDYGIDRGYLAAKKKLLTHATHLDLLYDICEELLSDVKKYNNERFRKIPDWEKQSHKLVHRLVGLAWERVALMGIAYEDLPHLFAKPRTPIPRDFNRPFHFPPLP